MKKILFILAFALIIIGCKSKSATSRTAEVEKPTLVFLRPSEASAAQSKKALDLGTRVLMTCNTSRFKAFNSTEATSSVIKNTTQERLTQTCHKFRLKYGDFKQLSLVEVVQDVKDNSFIYRYKAIYTKPIANKELRVTMNSENKVSSIKSTDWIDEYK